MKKTTLLLFALLIAAGSSLAQERDLEKQFGVSYGIRRGEIPSAYTNPDGMVIYTFEGSNLTFDATLWNISERLDAGLYTTIFGCYLYPDDHDPLDFSLGAQLGIEGHFHLLSNHTSPYKRWDLKLNASVGAQYCKFLPIDFSYGLSMSAIYYPHPQWGISLETGITGFLHGRFFRSIPTENNSILRLGVSHRF